MLDSGALEFLEERAQKCICDVGRRSDVGNRGNLSSGNAHLDLGQGCEQGAQLEPSLGEFASRVGSHDDAGTGE